MKTIAHISTALQVLGASIFILGISLYSTRAAVLCAGGILVLFGIALERAGAP